MAYNKSYYFDYKSLNGHGYRLEIYDNKYTGSPREGKLGGVGPEIDYESDDDAIFSPLKPSTLNIPFMVGGYDLLQDGLYIRQLRTNRSERDVYVFLYKQNLSGNVTPTATPLWAGYVLFDLSDEKDEFGPYVVNIKAIDGISSGKFYDMVPDTTTQSTRHVYEPQYTYLEDYATTAATKTFVEWIAECFNWMGPAGTTQGSTANTTFSISCNWYNESHPNLTQNPMELSRSTARPFYTDQEINEELWFESLNVYDVLRGICKMWGLRLVFWQNRYHFIQVSQYDTAETGTNSNPDNIRTYVYNMAGALQSTKDHVGNDWLSRYFQVIKTGTEIQKLEGGSFNVLPRLGSVDSEFNVGAGVNLFRKFPLLPDPWPTTTSGTWQTYRSTTDGTIGVFENPQGSFSAMFHQELWLSFSNAFIEPVRMQMNYTVVARAAGTTTWTKQLHIDVSLSNIFTYITYQVGAYQGTDDVAWSRNEVEIPIGVHSINITNGSWLSHYLYLGGTSGFTGAWEFSYETRMIYYANTVTSQLLGWNHGCCESDSTGGFGADVRPQDYNTTYANTVPGTGLGSSLVTPINASNNSPGNTVTTIVSSGDDTAHLDVEDLLWGDAFEPLATGYFEVYNGSTWEGSGWAGHWGENTLSGTKTIATLLGEMMLRCQAKPIKKYTGTLVVGLQGKYAGSPARTSYPNPIGKLQSLTVAEIATPTTQWITHTGTFNTVRDEWEITLYEYDRDDSVTFSTNTYNYSAPGSIGTGGGIPSASTGTMITQSGASGARIANPNETFAVSLAKKLDRNGLTPITYTDEIIEGSDEGESVTSIPIIKIGTALLKSGDKCTLRLRYGRRPTQSDATASINTKEYELTLTADQGASDTSLTVSAITVYGDIQAGSAISIDVRDLIAQYQNKDRGTIAGMPVDSDELGCIKYDSGDSVYTIDADTIIGVDLDYIKILPSDFLANDDNTTYSVAWKDGSGQTGVIPEDGALEMFAFVSIPAGKTATKVDVWGSNAKALNVYEHDVNAGAGMGTAIGTGTVNSQLTITSTASTATNYLVIKITTTATSNRIYGGKVTIIDTP
jgi:hypothetical protein